MKIVCLVFLLMTMGAFASSLKINPLGKSLKGKYVALEEIEVSSDQSQVTYKIKFMNTWKNRYVKGTVSLQNEYEGEESIDLLRKQALEKSVKRFKGYGINI